MPTGSGSLWVSYHQFWLIGRAGLPSAQVSSDASALIDLYPDGAMVRTGIAYGLVSVTAERLDEAPAGLNLSRAWEDVVEFSLGHDTKPPVSIAALEGGEPDALPTLTVDAGSAGVRVRVHALGRDLHYDEVVVDNPVEYYLIQSWPADPHDAAVLRSSGVRAGSGLWTAHPHQRPATTDPFRYGPPATAKPPATEHGNDQLRHPTTPADTIPALKV
jgi:hypothetical protein